MEVCPGSLKLHLFAHSLKLYRLTLGVFFGLYVVSLAPARARARTLKKTRFRVEGVSIFAFRPCFARGQKHLKQHEQQHRKQTENAPHNATPQKLEQPANMVQTGAKMAPNIDPGGLSEAAGAARSSQEQQTTSRHKGAATIAKQQ